MADELPELSEDERVVLLEGRCPRHSALLDGQRRCLYCVTEGEPFDWSATAATAAAKFDRWAHLRWARSKGSGLRDRGGSGPFPRPDEAP